MAPKQSKCARVASSTDGCGSVSKFVGTVLTALIDISVDASSGWRALDMKHVEYLVDQILEGKAGNTTLARPSIRCDDSGPLVSAIDGTQLLENGKHFIVALLQVKADHLPEGYDPDKAAASPGQADDLPIWLKGYVQDIFENGLYVDHKRAPEPLDHAAHVAMQVWSHDASQNKFCESSVADKIEAYEKILAQMGGDHGKAEAMIRSITGQRVTALRWKQFSQCLEPAFKLFLKDAKYISQAMILQNPYYTGMGEQKKLRLDANHTLLSAEWLLRRLESRGPVGAEDFVKKFCRVARKLQQFTNDTVKKYGIVATSFAAFNRVIDSLRTDAGRQKILLCLEQKINLDAGIPECKLVLDEMEKVKAGMDMRARGVGTTADVATTAASPGGVDADALNAAGPDALDLMNDDVDCDGGSAIGSGRAATKIRDPIIARATELADKERVHVNIHTDPNKFSEDCKTRMFPSHKVMSLIDASSSKLSVVKGLLAMVAHLPEDNAIFIGCGRRFEFVATMLEDVRIMFPQREPFVMQISTSIEQSKRNQPTYAVVLPMGKGTTPASIVVHGCRAKPSEKLRLQFPAPA
jgi:hypothetical protein